MRMVRQSRRSRSAVDKRTNEPQLHARVLMGVQCVMLLMTGRSTGTFIVDGKANGNANSRERKNTLCLDDNASARRERSSLRAEGNRWKNRSAVRNHVSTRSARRRATTRRRSPYKQTLHTRRDRAAQHHQDSRRRRERERTTMRQAREHQERELRSHISRANYDRPDSKSTRRPGEKSCSLYFRSPVRGTFGCRPRAPTVTDGNRALNRTLSPHQRILAHARLYRRGLALSPPALRTGALAYRV
jgi:hypothetical protein